MDSRIAQIQEILNSQKDWVLKYSPSPFMIWLTPVVKEVNKEGLVFELTGGLHIATIH